MGYLRYAGSSTIRLLASASMARPRVQPANRLRVTTACTACRKSKKRCSGSFPCTNCIHKGCGGSCTPFKSASRSHPAASRPSAPSTESESGRIPKEAVMSQNRNVLTIHREIDTPGESHSPEATHRTHPRMLRNLQGERVYVGKAASLSFLQLVRDTVTQHIGPSQFSHNAGNEDMLEAETHHEELNFLDEHCNVEQKRLFVQNYEAATSGLLHLGSDNDLTSGFSSPTDPKSKRAETNEAILDLVVAIGAQSCRHEPGILHAERFYFARGQQRTFSNFLEDPSMDLVRVFILMAFYMLGSCRRNAAFMYLGVASRAAVALGLHEDYLGSPSRDDSDQRLKLWMSLCVLDLLVSSILGRPSAISSLLPGHREEPIWIGTTLTESGLVASYHLSLILKEVINRLYGDKAASAETADVLLDRLNGWSECLPQSLRGSSLNHEDESIARQHTIGNLHVACSYHFAVILVTRPFLISALGIRLARTNRSLASGDLNEALEEDPAHSRLAAACIDSAVYMLQTCVEVYHSGLMLRNMCIMKAFIFAAALVLGFSMFSNRDIDPDIDEAFRGAIAILRMLAPQSAQAAHYLEISVMLEAAINQQRQRLATQARQRRNRYVSRIFSLKDSPTTSQRSSRVDEHEQESSTTQPLASSFPSYSWLQPGDGIGTVTPPVFSGDVLDWEGMDLPLWDSFPFVADSNAT